MAKLKVTLKRSLIGRPETQRKTVRSLGLRKLNSISVLPDVPTIRGQIFKVKHLVAVEEISDADAVKFDKKAKKVAAKADPVEEKVSVTKEKVVAEKKSVDVKKGPAIAEKVVKSEEA
ncbi:MAG: 50S ribosomal protein L30 [Selenomonadaceae bacterium]|nr:50S ribosomal protein L30 [Selenomonadaceae bacterium]